MCRFADRLLPSLPAPRSLQAHGPDLAALVGPPFLRPDPRLGLVRRQGAHLEGEGPGRSRQPADQGGRQQRWRGDLRRRPDDDGRCRREGGRRQVGDHQGAQHPRRERSVCLPPPLPPLGPLVQPSDAPLPACPPPRPPASHPTPVNSVAWAPFELGPILACASSDSKISVVTFNSPSRPLPPPLPAFAPAPTETDAASEGGEEGLTLSPLSPRPLSFALAHQTTARPTPLSHRPTRWARPPSRGRRPPCPARSPGPSPPASRARSSASSPIASGGSSPADAIPKSRFGVGGSSPPPLPRASRRRSSLVARRFLTLRGGRRPQLCGAGSSVVLVLTLRIPPPPLFSSRITSTFSPLCALRLPDPPPPPPSAPPGSRREETKEWAIEETLDGHSDWVRDVAWAPNTGLPASYIASASQVRLGSMGRRARFARSWARGETHCALPRGIRRLLAPGLLRAPRTTNLPLPPPPRSLARSLLVGSDRPHPHALDALRALDDELAPPAGRALPRRALAALVVARRQRARRQRRRGQGQPLEGARRGRLGVRQRDDGLREEREGGGVYLSPEPPPPLLPPGTDADADVWAFGGRAGPGVERRGYYRGRGGEGGAEGIEGRGGGVCGHPPKPKRAQRPPTPKRAVGRGEEVGGGASPRKEALLPFSSFPLPLFGKPPLPGGDAHRATSPPSSPPTHPSLKTAGSKPLAPTHLLIRSRFVRPTRLAPLRSLLIPPPHPGPPAPLPCLSLPRLVPTHLCPFHHTPPPLLRPPLPHLLSSPFSFHSPNALPFLKP